MLSLSFRGLRPSIDPLLIFSRQKVFGLVLKAKSSPVSSQSSVWLLISVGSEVWAIWRM